MPKRLGRRMTGPPVVFATPEPSAEGWLTADLPAVKRGMDEALERDVSLPSSAGRYPRDEEEAKQRLDAIVSGVLGQSPPRRGLELGSFIAKHIDLAATPSLEAFVKDLRAAIASL